MSQRGMSGVVIANGESGSKVFERILHDTADRFSVDLEAARPPRARGAFKKRYGDCLARFEAARIASPRRVDIARQMTAETLGSLVLAEDGRTRPLDEALADRVEAPTVETRAFSGAPGLVPEVPCDGRTYRGREVLELVDQLFAAHQMTAAARAALRWIVEYIATHGGALDLRGQRFALLGAGAELSPLPLLLAGGATVLWVDVRPPDRVLAEAKAGALVYHPGGDDLLGNPRGVLASVRRFAENGPVHLGLLAYAPGKIRELRVAGVMDALARALGAEHVRSVSMLVSPTSPGEMQPEDVDVARTRKHEMWKRALAFTPALPGPGAYGHGDAHVARAVVALQGLAYQAAQYLTKIASAEAFAADGLGGRRVVVSTNVAGITNTRSLGHPLFQAAFQGAASFGVRIFAPGTTRALNGLLMLHDLLNPDAPGSPTRAFASDVERARALRSQQIHGGVYDLPWQFEAAVRVAALIGLAKKPRLLFGRTTPQ